MTLRMRICRIDKSLFEVYTGDVDMPTPRQVRFEAVEALLGDLPGWPGEKLWAWDIWVVENWPDNPKVMRFDRWIWEDLQELRLEGARAALGVRVFLRPDTV